MHPILLWCPLLLLCHFCDARNSSISWNCTIASPTSTVSCTGSKVNETTVLWLEDSDLPSGIDPARVDALALSVPSVHVVTELSVPLPNLQRLDLRNSGVSSVSADAFGTLGSHLTGLSLTSNALASVPRDALKGTPHLTSLFLSNNTITSLQGEDFEGLTNISNLALRNNTVSSIADGTFARLENLVTLDLALNRLTAFNATKVGLGSCTAAVSTSCSLLESLNLHRNLLSGRDMVLHLPLLQQLDLSQNTISDLSFLGGKKSSLQSLIVLDLSRNRIGHLKMDVFVTLTKLQQLDLSQNEIDILDGHAFLGLSSLRNLDLSVNGLTYLDANRTRGLSSLEAANFSDNDIEYVLSGSFASSPLLRSVILTGNPLDCSCTLYTFARLLKTLSDDSISSAICDGSTTKVVEFDFTSLGCSKDHSDAPSQPATTTTLATTTSTETLTTVADSPTASTQAPSSSVGHSTTDLTTVPQLMDSTPTSALAKKFDGGMDIVHFERTNNTIKLFFSGHGLELPGKQINCSVSVGILGYSHNNITVQCPHNGENRTALVSSLDSKRDYEICLLAFESNNVLLRKCTIFNSTMLSMSLPVTTTTARADLPTTNVDSRFTGPETSATTITSTDATTQPTEYKHDETTTASTVLENVTLSSTETEGAVTGIHSTTTIPTHEKLVVNWKPSNISDTTSQPTTTTVLATITSTETLTTVSDSPTASTQRLMASTPTNALSEKFDGYMDIVHSVRINNTIKLFFTGHGLELLGKQINCSVSVGILGYSHNNITVQCPRNKENRTALVSSLDNRRDYEICLLAFESNDVLLRKCMIFNSTTLSVLPLTTGATPVITTTKKDSPTTRLKTSAATVTSTDATMQPTTEYKYDETSTASSVPVDVTLSSREIEGAGTSVPSTLMYVQLIPTRDKLVVNWEPSGFSVHSDSRCNFTITVLENNVTIASSEVLCSPGRQIDIKILDWCNDYFICLRSRNFKSVCHSISPTQLGMKCTKSDISVGAISGASGSGVGLPVSLMVVIAALVLTAVAVVIIIVLRRRRTHVVTRKKSSEGSIRMQVNRRSGSYTVKVADDSTTVNNAASLQTFGKVSQRASSVDEL
ncbi:mucin-2-like [Ornithodoros turicata]|uniref:mucin-2-like n=1 Tax=Ornithodoros turicata TaxID=34597 RepID=UPI00313A14AD